MSEFEKQTNDNDETLEKLDESLNELKSHIEPLGLIRQFAWMSIYNAVVIFGIIGLISYFWKNMPWLWWTAAVVYIALFFLSVFAYVKAKKAYGKLDEITNRD